MSVEELITKLQTYPPHFTVRAAVVQPEDSDLTADIVNVSNCVADKFVDIELDWRPS